MTRLGIYSSFRQSDSLGLLLISATTALHLASLAPARERTPNGATSVSGMHVPQQVVVASGLRSRVRVYRDTFGVPHSYAASPQDAYFALGYVHATDRFLQMDLFRRRASGRLAEV